MFITKKIVWWLAVLAWIASFLALLVVIYGAITNGISDPHAIRLGMHELPWPDRSIVIGELRRVGIWNQKETENVLREYVEMEVAPVTKEGRTTETYRNVTAALVLDPNGQAIAAYPNNLREVSSAFPYPLDSMPTDSGYRPYKPAPDDYKMTEGTKRLSGDPDEELPPDTVGIDTNKVDDWYGDMAGKIAYRISDTWDIYNWIIMDPITDENGKRIGALVTATNHYLQVGPSSLTMLYNKMDVSIDPFVALFTVLCCIAYMLTTIWVALDAKWRGTNGFVWALVYFVTFILGLALYLIARPPDPLLCPRCRKRLGKDHSSCPYCGLELRTRCPSCGALMLPDWRFCPKCNLDTWEVYVPPAPLDAPAAAPATPTTQRKTEIGLGLARPTPPTIVAGHAITIQVFDAQTGEAVHNAKVTCKGPTEQAVLLTDADGRVEARDAKPGIYKMLIRATGYQEQQLMEELKQDGRLARVIRIDPLPGRVSGNVYDAQTKLPLSPARIRSDSSRVTIAAETDGLGRFCVADAPAGPCILTCEFTGYSAGREPCIVPPGGEALIDFALAPADGKGILVAPLGEDVAASEKDDESG